MADLITLAELKNALGVDLTDTTNDAKYNQAIKNASAAIRSFTHRQFATPADSSTSIRSYEYDRSGILEIDEADDITSVVLDGTALTTDEYLIEPYGQKPYTWIVLPPSRIESPEMGFTRNMDLLWWKVANRRSVVDVTAKWGWASIPDDIKQAAIWTAVSFSETPRPYLSESIEGYSRTFANPNTAAIPQRARELLDPYVRGQY